MPRKLIIALIAVSLALRAGQALPAKTEACAAKPHSLGLAGVENARDLGGYATKDGRRVKIGVLLRSGKLSSATEEDVATLKTGYRLTLILDLRTTAETAAAPDVPIVGVKNVAVRILDENAKDSSSLMSSQYVGRADSVEDMVRLIRDGALTDDFYTGALTSEHMRRQYREVFMKALSNGTGSTLFHCTGGKDRTGIAAVLLLTALGVDRETCLQDFELTNDFLRAKVDLVTAQAKAFTDDPQLLASVAALTGVDRFYMARLFDEADAKYGSMTDFIKRGLGLSDSDITALRALCLE